MSLLGRAARSAARRLGFEIRRLPRGPQPITDPRDARFLAMWDRMTKISGFDLRHYTTYCAVRYLTEQRIGGDFVECGVYRGTQVLTMAHALAEFGASDRDIYLYDTFAGMTQPTPEDFIDADRPDESYRANLTKWEEGRQPDGSNTYKFASIEEVRANVFTAPYPRERFHFVVGDVLETVRRDSHKRIAFLRLDTDWYASTKHEFECLYDSVVPGGVVVIDDYGRWQGSRQATDEFFAARPMPMLIRTGPCERLVIKS
jgi:hypothetical protein